MKKDVFIVAIFGVIFALPISALATQNNQSANAQSGQSVSSTNSTSTATSTSTVTATTTTQSRTQSQTEVQVQTNNPETGVMTQEQTRTELQTELEKSQPTYTPTKQTSQIRLNIMSQAVEDLVTLASRLYTGNQAASIQIRTTAQEQIKAEDRINQSLDKAESRTAFAKFFIGPNYGQLKTAKQEMEQNRLRIEELNQVMSQISNVSDQIELESQIKILEDQNTILQEQLNHDTRGFSLFGWLSRMISKF